MVFTSEDLEKYTEEMFEQFGRSDITLTKTTYTNKSMGGRGTPVTSTSTITGKFHIVTVKDQNVVRQGLAQIGDAILVCWESDNVVPGDKVTVEGVDWYADAILGHSDLPNIEGTMTTITRRIRCIRRG